MDLKRFEYMTCTESARVHLKYADTLQKKKCEGHLSVRLKSIDGHTIFYHWGEITPTRERFYWCEVIRVTSLRYSCDFSPLFAIVCA